MFTVNGFVWGLQFVSPHSLFLRRSDGVYTLGCTDNNVKCVYIASNLSDEMKEKVLCHELTHVICFSYGILIDLETEEWICNFMADHGKEIINLLDVILYSVTLNGVYYNRSR